jgi:ABC-type branched-subunit amino acid transport system permease subunit
MMRAWFLAAEKVAPGGGGVAKMDFDRANGFKLLFWTVKGKNFDGVYYFCLLIAVIAVVLVWRIRRTGVGRSIIATRDLVLVATLVSTVGLGGHSRNRSHIFSRSQHLASFLMSYQR